MEKRWGGKERLGRSCSSCHPFERTYVVCRISAGKGMIYTEQTRCDSNLFS